LSKTVNASENLPHTASSLRLRVTQSKRRKVRKRREREREREREVYSQSNRLLEERAEDARRKVEEKVFIHRKSSGRGGR